MKNKKLILGILLLFGLSGLHAQEAIPASGGDATGSGGSSAYSIGQVVYTTHTGSNGSVAQGVQQPYEISVVTGLAEAVNINLQLKVYPNPTNDFLNLVAEEFNNQSLSYILFDINGQILQNQKLSEKETTISMEFLVPATYFLKVLNEQEEIKTFKIIKN